MVLLFPKPAGTEPEVFMGRGQWQKNNFWKGPEDLIFIFYLIFFYFLEKIISHLIIFFFFFENLGGAMAPASPPFLPSLKARSINFGLTLVPPMRHQLAGFVPSYMILLC
jgi:hypothetical protein